MKKQILIIGTITMLLLVSVVYAAVTNTDITNFVSKFAGKVGIGVTQPREALDVNGSIVLGTNVNETPGTVRYVNDRFEGRVISGWLVLNELSRLADGNFLYNDTTTIYFNGTKLNATIDARNTGKAADGDYLTNDSTTIYFNGTKLNATIDARNTGKASDGVYLYNDSTTMYFNGTKLNATIDARNTGKAADGTFLYNDSNTIYLNSTYALTNLNVNSSEYWDGLDTPLNILTLQTITVNNNLTVTNDFILSGEAFLDNITDRYGNVITTNSTCKIIQGATSTLSVC